MSKLSPEKILDALDSEQQTAVKAPIGPLRIIAGAGTGKTRTLIHRIAYWDLIGTAPAEKTLSVTHSNKSALELRHRLKALGVNKINAQTFHAAAKKQLIDNWGALSLYWQAKGYRDLFPTIISENSKKRSENQYWIFRAITQSIFKRAELSAKVKRPFDSDLYQALNTEVILLRARMTAIEDYESSNFSKEKIGSLSKKEFINFYELYCKTKKSNNLIDLADLLDLCILMLKENPIIAARIQEQYQHFLVDEYQDNDPVQNELLTQWLGVRDSLCIVGDPRQTIYSFKGAEPALLNDFDKNFPNCITVELNRNYRSSPEIVNMANKLMHETSASGKAKSNLVSNQAHGPEPKILKLDLETSEPAIIAGKIQALIVNKKIPFTQIAILLRVNSGISIFRQSLRILGIPTKSPGDTFWEDVLPIIQKLQKNMISSDADGIQSLIEILKSENWLIQVKDSENIDIQKQQKLDNAEALLALAKSLAPNESRSTIALVRGLMKMHEDAMDDNQHDAVTVTSIHKAKGMEWDAVLLPKFIEGVLPISYAKLPAEIDEERRLAYVAITRARKFLLISWSAKFVNYIGDEKYQLPSRFLRQLEQSKQKIIDQRTLSQKNVKSPPQILFQKFQIGDRVNTTKYGIGRVISIQGNSILINFGTLGEKKLPYFDPSIEKI